MTSKNTQNNTAKNNAQQESAQQESTQKNTGQLVDERTLWQKAKDNKWNLTRYAVYAVGVVGLIGTGGALYNCKKNSGKLEGDLNDLQEDYNVLEHQAQAAGVNTEASVKAVS